jgi:hypothetical protein
MPNSHKVANRTKAKANTDPLLLRRRTHARLQIERAYLLEALFQRRQHRCLLPGADTHPQLLVRQGESPIRAGLQ